MTEEHVRSVVASYDLLLARAKRIGFAWLQAIETPTGLMPHDERDLNITIEQEMTYLTWYRRGDNETEEFPTSLLWHTDAEIWLAADIEKVRRARRLAEKAEQARANQEANERRIYEHLKEKYGA